MAAAAGIVSGVTTGIYTAKSGASPSDAVRYGVYAGTWTSSAFVGWNVRGWPQIAFQTVAAPVAADEIVGIPQVPDLPGFEGLGTGAEASAAIGFAVRKLGRASGSSHRRRH